MWQESLGFLAKAWEFSIFWEGPMERKRGEKWEGGGWRILGKKGRGRGEKKRGGGIGRTREGGGGVVVREEGREKES